MADPLIAKVVPGLVLLGEAGAEKNREKVYEAVRATTFTQDGTPYGVPVGGLTGTPVATPIQVVFPMRDPEQDEGTGHLFVDGQRLEIDVRFELAAALSVNTPIYVGLAWDTELTVGVTDLATISTLYGGSGGFFGNMGWLATDPVGSVLKMRFGVTAMSSQAQHMEITQATFFAERDANGDYVGSSPGSASPMLYRSTADFSTTTARSLYVWMLISGGDANAAIDLKSASAYITGITGKND